ncbi:MAG: CoB--CoM heterodisulfide reductase iron-sulfur subunit A family protein [Acidobacteria bacterium]|jgi:heterodisulfide reductase subunit A|nr:CoB--CoM heterodisulfide reductase iron-sulfur subunit A family protein [Acidobacteriota bacterium]
MSRPPLPRIGVFVCNCGTNIARTVDCEEIACAAMEWPGVVVARAYKYMCSDPGQEMIAEEVREKRLDRVVVAACSPRMHEPTFRRALASSGLNPYLLEMANIREQCSWVHDDPRAATDKALALARAAVARVVRHEPLEKRFVPMNPATLVLGGGIAGMTAALQLADAGQPVTIVERADRLGGNVARIDLTAPHLDSARELLLGRLARVSMHPMISVLLRAELEQLEGYQGNFTADVAVEGASRRLEIGSVVVCTGYKEFDAARVEGLGYGRLPDVITSFELELMLKRGRIEMADGRTPRTVALVHCVGSRSEEYHGYCSRVCCMTALKYGHEVKSALPGAAVVDLYIDMHAFGKGCEDFYRKTAEIKTLFLMYGKNAPPVIRPAGPKDDCNLLITLDEKLSGEEIEVPADLVVLMVGMEPREDAGRVAQLVNISRDKDGWFIESHPKLDPVATTTDGIYIAGACQSPKDIPDSVAQARAAAARILAKVAKGKIEVDAIFAEVDAARCSGCRICGTMCPYGAIEYDEEQKSSRVVEASCKACGCCAAACPSLAVRARHFTDEQIFAQIEGVL